MKKKRVLTVGLAFLLACVPMLVGCEQMAEDALIFALNGFQKAAEPTVKEGKFHFSVTYEVGGEVKTISSVYVCKFKEAGLWLDGDYVTWESYIEDSELAALPPENNENLMFELIERYHRKHRNQTCTHRTYRLSRHILHYLYNPIRK